jgi:hypothetical protein
VRPLRYGMSIFPGASRSPRRSSERGAIALVMRSVDNSITARGVRSSLGRWRLTSTQGDGLPNPHLDPGGQRGGPADRRADRWRPDGSARRPRRRTPWPGRRVSANLGVNPSLTITARAERAIALWPNRGEQDPRPALGAGYVAGPVVPPVNPVVPRTAPAAFAAADRGSPSWLGARLAPRSALIIRLLPSSSDGGSTAGTWMHGSTFTHGYHFAASV